MPCMKFRTVERTFLEDDVVGEEDAVVLNGSATAISPLRME